MPRKTAASTECVKMPVLDDSAAQSLVDATMEDASLLAFVSDSLLKVQGAIPRKPGDSLSEFVEYSSLMLNIASLLSNQNAQGLGRHQQLVVHTAIQQMLPVARAALVQPLSRLTPGLIDLLRSLAKGTRERDAEIGLLRHPRGTHRCAEGRFSPGTVRTHRYVDYRDVETLVDGLTSAELFYETCYAGFQRLQKLVSTEYWVLVDRTLPCTTRSLVAWAIPLLFDGLRLRRGLEVAAPCGVLAEDQRAPFGLENTAVYLLGNGETSVDRERVGRAVQFLLASAWQGLQENNPFRKTTGGGTVEHPLDTVEDLMKAIKEGLDECRQTVEIRCLAPGRSMRILLDHIASHAENIRYSHGSFMFFQYAFAYPCLVPSNLRSLQGYDGGLLSVWDACDHLLRLHAQEHHEVLPLHALLCAVLGGVVGNLMSDTITGPFCVYTGSKVMSKINQLDASWPPCSSKELGVGAEGVCGKRSDRAARGKQISATSAVCDTIERKLLKPAQQLTPAVEARFDAALTMHVIASGLAQLPGVFDSRPSDGFVPLKRLYFAALHLQPGTPTGRFVEYNGNAAWETSPFTDGVPAWPAGTMPVNTIEMPWREVVGGALLSTGPLFCFSRQGFVDSLYADWKPLPAVARALEARERGSAEKAQSVMSPSEAMQLMTRRSQRHVADVVSSIDNLVKSVDGPPFVSRVVESLNAWSNTVYAMSNYTPLWEVSIAHFACPTHSNRRTCARVD